VYNAAVKGIADVIVISGGTGPGPRDVTVEAITPLFEKELPGFGELFRHMSYEKVGTSTIASRATAGITKGVLVFALPGSPDAVKLAMEKIILPESPHLVKMVRA
ncbi:MAG: MogA/MoaB family molybdenum cofactor biosynthesis protein, partial [Candidatus Methanomethylicaceae archaeon]